MLRALSLLLLVLAPVACSGDDGGTSSGSGDAPRTTTGAATRQEGQRSPAGIAAEEGSDDEVVAVFMGTSLTAGLGLTDPDDRYTSVLQTLADSAGIPVRVVNAGVSGETSAGGLRRVDWVLRDSPDVLVVELGANDGLRGHDPEAMEANLRAVIRRAREEAPGVRVVLAGMEAPPNLGSLYVDRFREVFPRVAREEQAVLIPFLLEGVAGEAEMNQGDRIHPNAAGHRRIAREVVWPVLEPVLRAAVERSGDGVGG